jgi:hypothetical protein
MGVEPIYVHRPNNVQTVTGLQSTDNIKPRLSSAQFGMPEKRMDDERNIPARVTGQFWHAVIRWPALFS